MKVQESFVLPKDPSELQRILTNILRDIATQLNQLSEGQLQAAYNAASSAPTAGSYRVGDRVRNDSPSELGSAGSKYVILEWVCTAESPLTFRECRVLTGN